MTRQQTAAAVVVQRSLGATSGCTAGPLPGGKLRRRKSLETPIFSIFSTTILLESVPGHLVYVANTCVVVAVNDVNVDVLVPLDRAFAKSGAC